MRKSIPYGQPRATGLIHNKVSTSQARCEPALVKATQGGRLPTIGAWRATTDPRA